MACERRKPSSRLAPVISIAQNRTTFRTVVLFNFVILLSSLVARAETPQKYRDWLDEEAVYLITDQERRVFERLETDDEFEAFIRAFWIARDPTTGTTRNEFKEDFEERRREANRLFRGYGPAGWRTERGRTYILLGPPHERRTFDHASEVWPIELWFYQVEDPKLPSFFYVLFYRRSGVGTYRMWDPIGEGPGVLMTDIVGSGSYLDAARAYRVIQTIDTDLFQAVTAPVPGQSSASSQMEFQQIMAVLEDYPNQTLDTATARRYEPGRGIVEADYAFRKLAMTTLSALLPSANGVFLHLAIQIEPENLFYERYEEMYYTVFDVEAELLSGDVPVYRIENHHEIEVPGARWSDVETRPVSLQGRFPVISGEYTLRLRVRNRIGRVFDTVEQTVRVPERLDVSRVLPAIDFESVEQLRGQMAFHFQEAFAVPHPPARFAAQDSLRAFAVIAPGGLDGAFALRARVTRGDEIVHAIERELPPASTTEARLMAFEIGLTGVAPGDYLLEVELGDSVSRELPFVVVPQGSRPPLVNGPTEPASSDGRWNVERARQHLALEQNGLALEELSRALEASPELETVRVQHALIALGVGEAERALESLQTGLRRSPLSYELLAMAGYACEQLGELERAVGYYEAARQSSKTDEQLLAALAGVYERLGQSAKAEALRKEMNP